MLFPIWRNTYKHIKIRIKTVTDVFKQKVAVFYKQLQFSLVYMNDVASVAETKQTLRNQIDNIVNFCYVIDMRLNVDETKKGYLEMEGILDITKLCTTRYYK